MDYLTIKYKKDLGFFLVGINMYGAEISNQENGKMFSYSHRDNMASV